MTGKAGKSVNIMVVDDNLISTKVMAKRLEKDDAITAISAYSGEEAVEKWKSLRDDHQNLDLVLMDMNMPGMDGVESSEALRDEGYLGPIVMVTANDTLTLLKIGSRKANFLAVQFKPFDKCRLFTLFENTSSPLCDICSTVEVCDSRQIQFERHVSEVGVLNCVTGKTETRKMLDDELKE